MRAGILWLLLLVTVSLCSSISHTSEETVHSAQVYLRKYGYLKEEQKKYSATQLATALRDFQRSSLLPINGDLDESTLHQMHLPRCGMKDGGQTNQLTNRPTYAKQRRKRFTTQSKWYKRHLTYQVVNWPWYLSQHQVRQAVKAAFGLWSNVSSLTFSEAQSDPANIRLAFYDGEHNDGARHAFDGPGGALAHAFFPRRGEAHFDNAEHWSLNGKGRNLFVVLAHEIGHTLGLQHSLSRNALMSPYYKKLGKDYVLNFDDVFAIQNLYGAPSSGRLVQLPGRQFVSFEDWSVEKRGAAEGGVKSYCQSLFDAVTWDLKETLYIFKGQHYWMVTLDGNVSEPQLTQQRWKGLPPFIEAAVVSGSDGKFYFFKGGKCWRYRNARLDVGFPKKCSENGLPRHPDTALYFQPLGRLVIFKEKKYFVLNEESMTVEPYYPRSIQDWNGVPHSTNAALTHPNGSVYFFKGENYWTFDQDKLRVTASGKWRQDLSWLSCNTVK
ncbi:matrix metalloproteinase-28 [Hyperolius riggenbachi]|uniref:matrix metalloproteinase-28 n=1 Tax=Hyperolius riggenbachi TaxID=752182 RepID=UPI0035A2F5DA